MDKQQKLKIAFPVLLVVMAFVWGPVFFESDPKNKANKNEESPSAQRGKSGINTINLDFVALSSSLTQKKARTLHADWGRNPFLPGYDSKDLLIEGIVWDEVNPKAIINGNIIGIGDQIGPSVVVGINQRSVIIRNPSGDTEIFLGEER